MNLEELRAAAEGALHRSPSKEREDAMYALSGKLDVVERRRFVRLSGIDLSQYLAPNDEVEVHRSMLPPDDRWYGRQVFNWPERIVVSVDRIGPDCVRLLVPGVGSMPVPVGDFVDAVLKGNAREPPAVNTDT